MQSERYDVAVVGGGAVGLASGWRAAQRGLRVVVLDAGEPGAWEVAAGMLAPVSEAEYGERELLELGLESLRRREPALAPTVRLALDIAGDHAVDPRRLVAALAPALAAAGGELRAGTRVR